MVLRRRAALGAALVACALVIGAIITQVGTFGLELDLLRAAAHWRGGASGEFFRGVSYLGYFPPLAAITAVTCVLLAITLRRIGGAIVLAATMLAVLLGNWGIKQAFARARPDDGLREAIAGYSMPSGHASATAAFATSVVLALHGHPRAQRIVGLALGAFALLTSISRVVLGVHFPTDVTAGALFGVGAALLLDAAARVRARPAR
ncbi:MAG: undecaprenyl pyrophosphate phosphatase [Thermoleophilia bacterium]|nr:undecaprenyl pyrophosphate phosphatase [Thermoleophilia bacterium]